MAAESLQGFVISERKNKYKMWVRDVPPRVIRVGKGFVEEDEHPTPGGHLQKGLDCKSQCDFSMVSAWPSKGAPSGFAGLGSLNLC